MAICLKHNQNYRIEAGEYCIYCGNPIQIVSTPATSAVYEPCAWHKDLKTYSCQYCATTTNSNNQIRPGKNKY